VRSARVSPDPWSIPPRFPKTRLTLPWAAGKQTRSAAWVGMSAGRLAPGERPSIAPQFFTADNLKLDNLKLIDKRSQVFTRVIHNFSGLFRKDV